MIGNGKLFVTPLALIRWCAVAAAALSISASAQETRPEGYHLQPPEAPQWTSRIDHEGIRKAIFLSEFANYAIWPDSVFDSPKMKFTFCIMGERAFADAVSLQTRGKEVDHVRLPNTKVEHHQINVRWLANDADPNGCQLLFVSQGQSKDYVKILSRLNGPTLTVGEEDDFVFRGGMVAIYIRIVDDNKFTKWTTLNSAWAKYRKVVLGDYLVSTARVIVETDVPESK